MTAEEGNEKKSASQDDQPETSLEWQKVRLLWDEYAIKREESRRLRWSTPLIVAIIGASLAGAANVVVTAVSGVLERGTEKEKAEDARILEMIKTGDNRAATANLKFLLETGLIEDGEKARKIGTYLQSHPDDGPFLPAPSDRYTLSASSLLTPTSGRSLQKGLDDYIAYIDKLGFPEGERKVTLRISDESHMLAGWRSYFDKASNEIVINESLAQDPDIYRREYSHYILLRDWKEKTIVGAGVLESDLVDYFVCSFSNRPEFGLIAAKSIDGASRFIRTLKNNAAYRASPERGLGIQSDEVWGGLFWNIRDAVGQENADNILAQTWRLLSPSTSSADVAAEFTRKLVATANQVLPVESANIVQNIMKERGFPL